MFAYRPRRRARSPSSLSTGIGVAPTPLTNAASFDAPASPSRATKAHAAPAIASALRRRGSAPLNAASTWPAMKQSRSGSRAAASGTPSWLSSDVIMAAPGTRSGNAAQPLLLLGARDGQHDEFRFGDDDGIVGADVDRAEPDAGLEPIVAVHADDERRRERLPGGKRNRGAQRAEPDDREPIEDRRALRPASGLHDRQERPVGHQPTPQPRRATGSTQMERPMAGAMMRSSAIRRSNCEGNKVCAPSLSA